jgi:hypothetical protein
MPGGRTDRRAAWPASGLDARAQRGRSTNGTSVGTRAAGEPSGFGTAGAAIPGPLPDRLRAGCRRARAGPAMAAAHARRQRVPGAFVQGDGGTALAWASSIAIDSCAALVARVQVEQLARGRTRRGIAVLQIRRGARAGAGCASRARPASASARTRIRFRQALQPLQRRAVPASWANSVPRPSANSPAAFSRTGRPAPRSRNRSRRRLATPRLRRRAARGGRATFACRGPIATRSHASALRDPSRTGRRRHAGVRRTGRGGRRVGGHRRRLARLIRSLGPRPAREEKGHSAARFLDPQPGGGLR